MSKREQQYFNTQLETGIAELAHTAKRVIQLFASTPEDSGIEEIDNLLHEAGRHKHKPEVEYMEQNRSCLKIILRFYELAIEVH